MITKELIPDLMARMEQISSPVLSLFLDVDPSRPENVGKAWLLRAKEAMRGQGVPGEVRDGVMDKLSQYPPLGRTRIVFAAEGLWELLDIQPELPFGPAQPTGAVVRWGSPLLIPLLVLLSEHGRYGVVCLGHEYWRLFEVRLGDIEELPGAYRDVDTAAWRRLAEEQIGSPPGVPARGGSGKDNYATRMSGWTQRFFRQTGEHLAREAGTRGWERLILVGAESETAAYQEFLPGALAARVVGRVPGLTNPKAPATEVLERIRPLMSETEDRLQMALLDTVRERGLSGLDPVIEALQQGRVQVLVLPRETKAVLYGCTADGRVSAHREAAATGCAGETEERPMLETLVTLCGAHGGESRFVRGEAASRLRSEFGGLAALIRW